MDEELIDVKGLLSRTMDDEEIAKEILLCYLEGTPLCLTLLKKAVESGDLSESVERSHEVKGSSASVGAIKMQELSSMIQNRSENKKINDVKELTDELIITFEKTVLEINQLVSTWYQ